MRRRREARTRLVDRKVALVNRDDRVSLGKSGVALLVGTGALLESFIPRRQRAVALAIRGVAVGHGTVTLAVGLPAVGEGLVTLGAGAVATLDRLVAGCDRLVTRDVGHLALALDRRAQLRAFGQHPPSCLPFRRARIGDSLLTRLALVLELTAKRAHLLARPIALGPRDVELLTERFQTWILGRRRRALRGRGGVRRLRLGDGLGAGLGRHDLLGHDPGTCQEWLGLVLVSRRVACDHALLEAARLPLPHPWRRQLQVQTGAHVQLG